MSSDQSRKPVLERIWDFFASVKLSFFLLLLLAVLSVAGTLIPQKETAEHYARAYGEAGWRFINALGLNDLYHTPWFVLVLALLAANLIICSVNRLSLTLRILGKDPAAEAAAMRKPRESFTLPGSPAANLERVKGILQGFLGKVSQVRDQDRVILFAQRGGWSRFGVYVVHTSVLVIMAGALVGNFWGFSGHVNITEGQTVGQIVLDSGHAKPLGFSLRLDKFTVSFYKNGMPSEYRSEVTFLDQGKAVKKASLIVNDPAAYRGIDFYQASYGTSVKKIWVNYTKDGKTHRIKLFNQQWSELPGGGRAGVMAFRERVRMGALYDGPVARILYQPEQQAQPQQITAFKAGAKVPMRGPVKFELLKAETAPYSGLQVKYDPGVWLIWVGCTLMVVGFFIAFYFSHRKVWLRLSPTGKGRTRVELAASTNKNRPGLTRLTAHLASKLRAHEKTGK